MEKRLLSVFSLAICFLLLTQLIASADVIVEPNNAFYYRNSRDCQLLNRGFYANGDSGSVSIKTEPGAKGKVSAVIKNGEVINIMFTYNYQGETWGVTQIYDQDKPYDQWPNGWIPISQLLLKYDYISFAEEHQKEFYPYGGNYEELKTAKSMVLWPWPGSGNTLETFEMAYEYNENFGIDHVYQDEDGREWGFLGYWYGNRNIWICLSDLTNSNIPAFNPEPRPELLQPDLITPQEEANTFFSWLSLPLLLIIILVAALIIVTAVLIRIFWKPSK